MKKPELPYRHEAKDEEYLELNRAIGQSLQHHQFKARGLLQQMLERGKWDKYNTFKEYLKGEWRLAEVTGYRLIFAHKMDTFLRENGCQPPSNERQIRPLSPLKKAKQRLLAWSRAVKMSQTANPTYADVQREVNRILIPTPSKETHEPFREYRKHLLIIRAELRSASKILEDGVLEPFLLEYDTDDRSQRQIRRVAGMIVQIGVTLGDHYRKFGQYIVEPPQGEEE